MQLTASTSLIQLAGISCHVRLLQQWVCSVTGCPGEASLKSSISNMPGRHFFTLLIFWSYNLGHSSEKIHLLKEYFLNNYIYELCCIYCIEKF